MQIIFSIIQVTEDSDLLEKLIGNTLIGLGSQAVAKGTVACPPETTVLALIDPANAMSKQFCKDAEKMSVWICLSHESVRARKKLNRGFNATTQKVDVNFFTQKPLGTMVPEQPRCNYSGYTTGDCIAFVTALSADKLWSLPRKDKEEVLGCRKMNLPPGADMTEDESVFSASILPLELYAELIHTSRATTTIDLSPGQGDCLKACLLSRCPALAIAGTECHAAKLELILTQFVYEEQQREGSTFWRSEACPDESADEAPEAPTQAETKKRGQDKERAADKKRPKKKAAPKPKSKPANNDEAEGDEGEDGADADDGAGRDESPLPW